MEGPPGIRMPHKFDSAAQASSAPSEARRSPSRARRIPRARLILYPGFAVAVIAAVIIYTRLRIGRGSNLAEMSISEIKIYMQRQPQDAGFPTELARRLMIEQ